MRLNFKTNSYELIISPNMFQVNLGCVDPCFRFMNETGAWLYVLLGHLCNWQRAQKIEFREKRLPEMFHFTVTPYYSPCDPSAMDASDFSHV